MGSDSRSVKQKRTGSKILWQITILVLTIFIISAGFSWLFYRRSTNELIENDKQKLIKTQATNMSSTFGFVASLLSDVLGKQLVTAPGDLQNLVSDMMAKKISPIQTAADEIMKKMIDSGALGLSEAFVVMPAFPPIFQEPTVAMSDNESHVYEGVPESIAPLYDTRTKYLFLENGIPEWDMEKEQLVVYSDVNFPGIGQIVKATAIKPMHKEIQSITSYYEKQRKKVDLIMTIVIVSSLVVLFVITYFALNFLIRTRITKPIEELSEAAAKVMDGDLDVEIPIKSGEEFEGLKRAFSEMLASIRAIMSRAMGDD